MSYSLGPYVGKRDALIAAVKKSAESYSGQSREEIDAAVAFIIPALQKLNPGAPSMVTASGSSTHSGDGASHVAHNVQIGMFPSISYYGQPIIVDDEPPKA